MKQIISRKGKILIDEVPPSGIDRQSALVRVSHSVVSVGSEMSGVGAKAGDSVFRRVIKDPSKALKGLELIAEKGLAGALHRIGEMQRNLDEAPALALGYSCSGTVVAVGEGITDLKVGDRVACGGAGRAVHAELVSVPRNLMVKVPLGVDLLDAASATVGAIAMQGVRRADVRIGEYVAVVGLGLIGLLTAQILNAAGCRVIGIEPVDDKLDILRELGCHLAVNPETMDTRDEIQRHTGGHGVDAAIITASSQSDEIIQQAMEITRKKGLVVVVGAVGLGPKRDPFYRKEIDLRISCSYGPGRYDENYEERGQDYPYPYVRWTENRNMGEYLRLLADGKVDFSRLVSMEAPVKEAALVYEKLKEPGRSLVGIVFRYWTEEEATPSSRVEIPSPPPRKARSGVPIKVGIIGAGGFARQVHLPNLRRLPDLYDIHAVASRNGLNAKDTAAKYHARYATSDYREIIGDPEVEMVLIATRHDLHCRIAVEAARAGKAVLVEKPMALDPAELEELEGVIRKTGLPFLVGFNRRFSPFALRARELTSSSSNPLLISYRVNARPLSPDHWVYGPEGGGRLIGEACHMIDFFSFMTGSSIVSADVSSLDARSEAVFPGDNFFATLKYADGSACSLLYTTQGSGERGKERVEIFIDGHEIVIDDFKDLTVFGSREGSLHVEEGDKGHLRELECFAAAIREGFFPISLDSLVDTTRATILLHRAILSS